MESLSSFHIHNRNELFERVLEALWKQPHLPLRQIISECVAEMVDELSDSEVKPDAEATNTRG